MPDGDGSGRRQDAYNADWCQERHEHIDKEFKMVWSKMDSMQRTLMGIALTLIANLGGIIATLIILTTG